MARSGEFNVVQPPTRTEVLHAIANAIRNDESLTLTLLGEYDLPPPEEFDVVVAIRRVSYSKERYLTLSGTTQSGETVYVGVSPEDEPAKASISS